MLPDRSLPELNDMLLNRLNAGQFEDSLILRYATSDIVQPVEQAYLKRNQEFDRQKLPHCGGPLTYYFYLRYDPAFGTRRNFAAISTNRTCLRSATTSASSSWRWIAMLTAQRWNGWRSRYSPAPS